MYQNLCLCVWGGGAVLKSASFCNSNNVKQGLVISPLLCSLYMNELYNVLKEFSVGCHVELI